MLIQVIHCHPLTDSYNRALFETIELNRSAVTRTKSIV
jgi:hypothetical protein